MGEESKPHATFRVKGVEMEPFDTLQTRMVVHIDELRASENVEGLFVQRALEAAANLSELWAKHKDNIELASEEGQ